MGVLVNPFEPGSEEYDIWERQDAMVLDRVHEFIGRFVAYPSDHAHVAHTLWIAHAWLMDAWESTPRIAFLSPEPGSGKSRALEVTEPLVPRPILAVNVTPAYLFRKVGDPEGRPTILFDEIDTVFGPKAKDNEEIRGLLNAGHRQGGVAGRCYVKGRSKVETEEIPAYSALAMAGLGNLPDTIMTRSVIVRMRRRAPNERVQPYRRRVHRLEAEALYQELELWAAGAEEKVTWPDLPEGITDRNADVWEPLIAVADVAGGEWPDRARVAAVALVAELRDDKRSIGIRLLGDLRTIFGDQAAMSTFDIITELCRIEDGPWSSYRGGVAIDPRGVSQLLDQYGVSPITVRVSGKAGTPKGYKRLDLVDSWNRYLTPPSGGDVPIADDTSVSSQNTATSATSATCCFGGKLKPTCQICPKSPTFPKS